MSHVNLEEVIRHNLSLLTGASFRRHFGSQTHYRNEDDPERPYLFVPIFCFIDHRFGQILELCEPYAQIPYALREQGHKLQVYVSRETGAVEFIEDHTSNEIIYPTFRKCAFTVVIDPDVEYRIDLVRWEGDCDTSAEEVLQRTAREANRIYARDAKPMSRKERDAYERWLGVKRG